MYVKNLFDAAETLGGVLIWSAQARLRFGTGRHVCQSESGDTSPHFKPIIYSQQETPTFFSAVGAAYL
jgi:hypothetical protein